MVHCAIVGCGKNSNRHKDTSFFSIPAKIEGQCDRTRELSTQRRREWIAKINRKEITDSTVKSSHRVCNLHFKSGKPSSLFDHTNPDWVPSLHLGHHRPKEVCSTLSVNRYERSQKRKQVAATSLERKKLHSSEPPSVNEHHYTTPDPAHHSTVSPSQSTADASCQTDFSILNIKQLETECQQLRTELKTCKERLLDSNLSEDGFRGNDEKVRFYTGLITFQYLMTVFDFLAGYVPHTHRNAIPKFQEYIMFLMRLRLNLSLQDLAFRFKVSKSTVSRIFEKWLEVSYLRLGKLVHWPDRASLRTSMPTSFKDAFGCSVAIIIDCFEVFIEKPSSLLPRAITWSQYKHHNTIKFLIGITPQGSVSFLSQSWGGRASDKCITENCGLLKKLLPGDVILADRGFDISDSIGFMCAKVLIPAFTRGKSQLSICDVNETRKIASLRIHVERVIGLVRNKYTILQGILPIDIVSHKIGENQLPMIDKIGVVACALCNICPSIVPID